MLHEKVDILRNIGHASGAKVLKRGNIRRAVVSFSLHAETEQGRGSGVCEEGKY